MHVRLRLPELLDERDMTAYQLSNATKGEISMSTAYRLMRLKGRLRTFDADMLEALCTALECEVSDLFERDRKRR